ncbi:MAG: stage II sporulation protein P [Eubacteriales bacterium]|nr:stage II sporulation protein P [Eubacteriales bacterium]
MKLLDKVVQAVLTCCIVALACYILIQSVAIAGENGLFRDSPVLSAIYRRIEKWTAGTYIPVISYAEQETETKNFLEEAAKRTFPVYGYAALQDEKDTAIESGSEYEMIVRAQAQAEENMKPKETQDYVLPETSDDADIQENLMDFQYLLNHYFSMDVTTAIDEERLDGKKLLAVDCRMEKRSDAPQILIYHTHSQEGFVDSVEGDASTTIVGVGDYLTEILRDVYGYNVIHETGVFDLVDGVLDRSLAYDFSEEAVTSILEQYPTIEVVIDLHRDGVDGVKFVTEYNGKPAAKLMYIAGMSRTADNVDIPYLPNPYIEDNLAFALQLQLKAQETYPDLMRNIYLMAYRFNLHLRPKSLLLEAGTQLNTLQEEKNAMEAFAAILDKVLSGR